MEDISLKILPSKVSGHRIEIFVFLNIFGLLRGKGVGNQPLILSNLAQKYPKGKHE